MWKVSLRFGLPAGVSLTWVLGLLATVTSAFAPTPIAWAQKSSETHAGAETSQLDIDGLADQMSRSPSFEVRELAMQQLWSDYTHSRERVEQLSRSADPEVARRGRWILDRWSIGLLPELPYTIRRQLANTGGNPVAAFETLLNQGRVLEAVEVGRQAMLTEGNEEIRTNIANTVARRFPQLVHSTRAQDRLELFLELLEVSAETPALAVARVILLQKLGTPLNAENILPQCGKNWSQSFRQEVSATCWAVLGDYDQAIEIGRKLPQPELLSRILLLAGRWDELASLASDSTETDLPIEATMEQHLVWFLASKLAGRDDDVDQVTEKLVNAKSKLQARWTALAIAGKLDAAIEVAQGFDIPSAVELLESQLRHEEAFTLLEVHPANPQPAMDRMLASAATELAPAPDSPFPASVMPESVDRLLAVLQLLSNVGMKEYLRPNLLRIAALEQPTDSNNAIRRKVLFAARRLGQNDLTPTILATLGAPDRAEDSMTGLYSRLFADGSSFLFSSVASAISQKHAEASDEEKWSMILTLLDGDLPTGWDKWDDLNTLHKGMTGGLGAGDIRQSNRSAPSVLAGQFFARLGRDDLAAKCDVEAIVRLGNPVAILNFAEHELARGNTASALTYFEMASEQLGNPDPYMGFWRSDPYDTPTPSISASMLGQALSLRQLGRVDEAEELLTTLDLVPFQPLADSGLDYLARLESLEQPDRLKAASLYDLRFMALASDPSDLYSRAYAHAMMVADDNPGDAARWIRIAIIGTITSPYLYPRGYVSVPAMCEVLDAVEASKRKDADEASAALTRAARQYPMDISMAEEQLPKLRTAGMDFLVDREIDRIFETGRKYLVRFPRDANSSNNLAWVSTINGRNYEASLKLASQAVFLEPDSISYRDTLAEVLFRLGRRDEAIAVERQCVIDQPDHWHLYEQLQRFQSN